MQCSRHDFDKGTSVVIDEIPTMIQELDIINLIVDYIQHDMS